MALDFQQSAAVQHSGSKGTVRERDVQRDFLEKYLPSAARVTGSGELLSGDGRASGQCDIMIVDSDTPPLWKAEDYQIVPSECCFAIVEVKSNLTVEELKKAWSAARKAKALPRTAYLPDPSPITYTRRAYGREWSAFPPLFFVFAYEGATLDTLGQAVSLLAASEPDIALGIDAICVLNRGVISWQEPVSGDMLMRSPSSVVFSSETSPGDVLMFMTAALNKHLSTARYNPRFDITQYMQGALGAVTNRWVPMPPHQG